MDLAAMSRGVTNSRANSTAARLIVFLRLKPFYNFDHKC